MQSRDFQSFQSRQFYNPVNPDSDSGCHVSSALTRCKKDLTSLIEYGIIINKDKFSPYLARLAWYLQKPHTPFKER